MNKIRGKQKTKNRKRMGYSETMALQKTFKKVLETGKIEGPNYWFRAMSSRLTTF